MSYYERKRRTSEKQEVQLSIERRQHIQNLFEKKFSYKKPADGSWCLPKYVCSKETNKDKLHHHEGSLSQVLNKSCDSFMNQSESLDKSDDQFETSFSTLKELWTEEKYIEMKNELNELKNNLNDKNLISWHNHTRSVNLAGGIAAEIQREFRPELCTQAWCKFYEIATTYLDLDEKEFLFSVHLCEAPGAFVTSLNHYMLSTEYQGDWDWIATTLNPYYEGNDNGHMIGDDRLIRHTRNNWYFGVDNTGNLMSERNLEGLKKVIGNRQVDLVTADGSIDCQGDPAEQEDVVSRLQHCEALSALQILSKGGDFVLKMFTLLECKAIGLMYLLNCVFEEVNIFKPCTSKGGNSEVYVVCKKFKGVNDPHYLKAVSALYFDKEPDGCLFSGTEIPASFLSQHTECNSFFKELQMTSIQRNLDLYRDWSEGETQQLEAERQFCVECFLQRYKVVSMVYQWRVIKYKKKKPQTQSTFNQSSSYEMQVHSRENEGRFCGSFDDRLLQSGLPWKQKVKQYKTYNVAGQKFETWIENPHDQIVSFDLEKVVIAYGEPVAKLESSRFCYGKLIQQTQEIIHNVKWLSEESSNMKDIKKKEILAVVASHNNSQVEPLETEEQAEMLPAGSPLCPDAAQRYDVCCVLDEKFELNEQEELMAAVRSIMEKCENGGSVVIEMRSCLTRITAGLVYILYKSFRKIGFVSSHGDILKQRLLCLDNTQSNVSDYNRNFCSTSKDETGFSRLEVVPISQILDGGEIQEATTRCRSTSYPMPRSREAAMELQNTVNNLLINSVNAEFCSFLQTANTRLLQSFITTIIERERSLLVDNNGIT